MTREEFIEILDKEGYRYVIEGDKIVVTNQKIELMNKESSVFLGTKTLPPGVVFKNGRAVYLGSLETLPRDVEFNNGGDVSFYILETLPPGVVFNNRGNVGLDKLKTLPPGVVFNNKGSVHLKSLKTISPGVEFNNGGGNYIPLEDVYLGSLIGGQFGYWNGNIEGVDSNRLLNVMIKRGVFI
jgi:hypothetical protein